MKEFHAEVLSLTKFDECSDLSTTYLGKTDMTRETKIIFLSLPVSTLYGTVIMTFFDDVFRFAVIKE